MKNLLSVLLFAALIQVPGLAFAQDTAEAVPADAPLLEEAAVVIADVNVTDAYAEEVKGELKGQFSLQGKMGMQNGIVYGVVVTNPEGAVLDVAILGSGMSVKEGEILPIPFVYAIPPHVHGDIEVVVKAMTDGGVPLGSQPVYKGTVGAAQSQQFSCTGGASVSCTHKAGGDLILSYHGGSYFGPIVQEEVVNVAKGKTMKSAATLQAGKYVVTVRDAGTGSLSIVPYTVEGTYGKIRNVVIYTGEDGKSMKAVVSVDTSKGLSTTTAVAATLSGAESTCGQGSALVVGNVAEFTVETKDDCELGSAFISLLVSDGTVLDSKTEVFNTEAVDPSTQNGAEESSGVSEMVEQVTEMSPMRLIAVGIVVILGLFALLFIMRRMRGTSLMVLMVGIGFGIFGQVPEAHALTLMRVFQGPTNPSFSTEVTYSTNQSSYTPGSTVTIYGDLIFNIEDVVGPSDWINAVGSYNNVLDSTGPATTQIIPFIQRTATQIGGTYAHPRQSSTVVIPDGTLAGAHFLKMYLASDSNTDTQGGFTDFGNLPITVNVPTACTTSGTAEWGVGTNKLTSYECVKSYSFNNITPGNTATANDTDSSDGYTGSITYRCVDGSLPPAQQWSFVGSSCVAAPPSVTANFTSTPNCSIAADQAGCNVTLGWNVTGSGTVVLTNCADVELGRSSGSGAKSASGVYVPYGSGCYRLHDSTPTGPILATTNTPTATCTITPGWNAFYSMCLDAISCPADTINGCQFTAVNNVPPGSGGWNSSARINGKCTLRESESSISAGICDGTCNSGPWGVSYNSCITQEPVAPVLSGSAQACGQTSINLSWNDPGPLQRRAIMMTDTPSSPGNYGYALYQDGSLIYQGTSPSRSVTGLNPNTRYVFTAANRNQAGFGASSNQIVVNGGCGPSNTAPTAQAGEDKYINVGQTAIPSVTSATDAQDATSALTKAWTFRSGPGPTPTITNGNTLSPTFGGFTAVGAYTFRLTVTDTGALTNWDEMIVNVSTGGCCGGGGGTPSGGGSGEGHITATAAACSTGRIDISWTPVTGATSYTLRDGTTVISSGNTGTSFMHIGLTADSVHNYNLRAEGPNGNSAYSSPDVSRSAPSTCPPPSCINLPAHATYYSGANTSVTADTPAIYSPSDTAAKCEYGCTYGWNGTSCNPPPASADLTAVNTNPSSGATYPNPTSITFMGTLSNSGSGATPASENTWADVEIDWNQSNCSAASSESVTNAGGPWTSIASGATRSMSASLSKASSQLRNGTHCYRMIADRDNLVTETNNNNNAATPWRQFTVSGLPQCSDGIDNDGDGQTDYPADGGCTSDDDTDETGGGGNGPDLTAINIVSPVPPNNPVSVTLAGVLSNTGLGATAPSEQVWGDVEIDWNQANCAVASVESWFNAGGPWTSIASGATRPMSAILTKANSQLRNGSHCWRMIADRDNLVTETDNTNNASTPWQTFSIFGLPQCSDGIDNDGDGQTDYPADGGCTSDDDTDETGGAPQCSDGIDNDGDGKTDFPTDPGCVNGADPDESDSVTAADLIAAYQSGAQPYTAPTQVTFTGVIINVGMSKTLPTENVWGDVEIDWNQANCAVASVESWFNAGGPWTSIASGPRYSLSATLTGANSQLRNGNHCMRFIADRDNLVTETDNTNNASTPWQTFSIFGLPQCSDGIDNDGDGKTDFPADGGCTSDDDTDETGGAPQCSDGIDNDGDGKTDFPTDPGCVNGADTDETDGQPQCSDGADNDGDLKTDFPTDPGCVNGADTDETDGGGAPQCSDGADNDGDGKTDFPSDPGCVNPGDTDETDGQPECSDGADNDGDGQADNPADTDCTDDTDDDEGNTTPAPTIDTFEVCNPGFTGCVSGPGTKSVPVSTPLVIRWSATDATMCSELNSPTDFSTGPSNPISGNDPVTAPSTNGTTNYTIVCQNGATGPLNTRTVTVATTGGVGGGPTLTINPPQTVVETGSTVTIGWDTGVDLETSCRLTGGSFGTALNPIPASGAPSAGSAATVVTGKTTYTLTCPGGTDTLTVDVIPAAWES